MAKRKNKYDEKLKIDGDFHDLMKELITPMKKDFTKSEAEKLVSYYNPKCEGVSFTTDKGEDLKIKSISIYDLGNEKYDVVANLFPIKMVQNPRKSIRNIFGYLNLPSPESLLKDQD